MNPRSHFYLVIFSLLPLMHTGQAGELVKYNPIQITGLYPTGYEIIEDSKLVLFKYLSDPIQFTPEGNIKFHLQSVKFNNWTTDWFYVNSNGDLQSSIPSNPPFQIGCKLKYEGTLNLTTKQLRSCRPEVLLLPSEGAVIEPKIPQPSFISKLFGGEPPIRGKKTDKDNVVFLMIDTLRRDHLPAYGHPDVIAPHSEILASLGVLFKNSYGASCSTRPSVGSIFTGLQPKAHGATRHALDGAILYPSIPLMAESFKKAGYSTAAVSSNSQITKAFGFSRGFDSYICPVSEDEVTPYGLKQLQKLDEPFFLYLHYIAPHQPYEPAAPWKTMYKGKYEYDELDAYCAEITIDDRRIGLILKELCQQGLLNHSLIWLLSDHGEEFWEHGWNGHGAKLYEESVQTVSIVSRPGVFPLGDQVNHPMTHADIFPTMIGYFGWEDIPFKQGISMMPFINKDLPDNPESRPLYLHHGGGLEPQVHESDKDAILFKHKKLIWWNQKDEWEFYTLENDPLEKNNIIELDKPDQAHYQSMLKQHLDATATIRDTYISPNTNQENILLTDRDRENLEHLGYIGSNRKQEEEQ